MKLICLKGLVKNQDQTKQFFQAEHSKTKKMIKIRNYLKMRLRFCLKKAYQDFLMKTKAKNKVLKKIILSKFLKKILELLNIHWLVIAIQLVK